MKKIKQMRAIICKTWIICCDVFGPEDKLINKMDGTVDEDDVEDVEDVVINASLKEGI